MKRVAACILSLLLLLMIFTGFSASAFAADYNLTCPRCGQVSLQLSEALRAGSTKRDVYTCEKCGAQIDKGTLLGCVSWYKVEGGTPAGSLTTPKRYYGSGQNTGGTYYYNSGNTTQTSIVNNNTFNTVTNNTWTSYQIQNTYYNNTYNYYKYETTNNYTYYVTYSPTYVNIYGHDSADGESTANDTDSQLYYSLPDGRNSFYCTASDVFGTSYLYNVKNADLVLEDDGKTLGLWHLDGNFYDSSNFGNHGVSPSYWFMDGRWSGGFRVSKNSVSTSPQKVFFPFSGNPGSFSFMVFVNDTTGHAKIPFNLKTPFGSYSFEVLTMQWNYIYIESNLSNSVIVPFVNGVSVSLSPASTSSGYGVSLNLNSFEIFNDSVGLSNYCIFDEIRVCRFFADKVFPQQPFDSNMVYVYPASPSENDVVVQSALNVSSYRVGGARPTYPSNGTVFINVDKNVVKNIMQYDGGLWKDVNAAIYKNGEWFNLMNFDLAPITSSEDEIPPVTDGEDPGGSGSGSGGSGEGDGSDSSLWDKLFGSIGDVVGAIASGALTILTKIVEGLATLITTLFNAFSDFSGIADGFSGFLSDVFPYIPPEIVSLLILGIALSIAMAFIRFLRG